MASDTEKLATFDAAIGASELLVRRGEGTPRGQAGVKDSSSRRLKTSAPRAKNCGGTTELSTKQVENAIEAAEFAQSIGMPLNRFLTLGWEYAEVADPSEGTARFLKLAADAARKRGFQLCWVWAHEHGSTIGGHTHILIHIPPLHQEWFKRRCWGWVKQCGMLRRRGARHSCSIGRIPEAYHKDLGNLLEYILKDACAAARRKFGFERIGNRGFVRRKRSGVSQNIGRQARHNHRHN
jgi:hypothetical protein